MKKNLLILLFVLYSGLTFAQNNNPENYLDLMNCSHKDIIEMFGIPENIVTIESKSAYYNAYYHSIGDDIKFEYEGIDIIFDTPPTDIDYLLYSSENTEISPHVCGFTFYKSSKLFKFPYEITFDDTFDVIIKKLGNPDSYSKEKTVYIIPVKNEKLKNRNIPCLKSSTADDILVINWKDSKISSIKLMRNHKFTIDMR